VGALVDQHLDAGRDLLAEAEVSANEGVGDVDADEQHPFQRHAAGHIDASGGGTESFLEFLLDRQDPVAEVIGPVGRTELARAVEEDSCFPLVLTAPGDHERAGVYAGPDRILAVQFFEVPGLEAPDAAQPEFAEKGRTGGEEVVDGSAGRPGGLGHTGHAERSRPFGGSDVCGRIEQLV